MRSYSVTRLVQGQINPFLHLPTSSELLLLRPDIHTPLVFVPRQLGNCIPPRQTFAVLQTTPWECYRWQTFPRVVAPGPLATSVCRQPPHPVVFPCPTPASVPCRDREELREGAGKRQGLLDARWLCNHLPHCSGTLVTSFCHHKPPQYRLTQHRL